MLLKMVSDTKSAREVLSFSITYLQIDLNLISVLDQKKETFFHGEGLE